MGRVADVRPRPSRYASGMSVRFRAATPADLPGVVALHNAVNPDNLTSLEVLQAREGARRPDLLFRRLAAEEGGDLIGMATYGQNEWTVGADRLFVNVLVHPAWQGRGVGRALYGQVLEEVAPHAPGRLLTFTAEDRPRALRFLAERGWREVARERPSALTLAGADLSGRAAALTHVEAQGYRIVRFADLQGDPQREQKFYDLDLDAGRDVPMPEGESMSAPPLERYWQNVRASPHFDPTLWFVAVQDGAYAGLSQLYRTSMPGVLTTGFTGTARAHRRRGLALALKLTALTHARDIGAREVRTENNAKNRPMLAINDALGFQARPAGLTFALEWPRG